MSKPRWRARSIGLLSAALSVIALSVGVGCGSGGSGGDGGLAVAWLASPCDAMCRPETVAVSPAGAILVGSRVTSDKGSLQRFAPLGAIEAASFQSQVQRVSMDGTGNGLVHAEGSGIDLGGGTLSGHALFAIDPGGAVIWQGASAAVESAILDRKGSAWVLLRGAGPVDLPGGMVDIPGDGALVKLDGAGVPVAVTPYNGAWQNQYTRLEPADDGVLLLGRGTDPIDFGGEVIPLDAQHSAFAARFGGDGALTWHHVIEGGFSSLGAFTGSVAADGRVALGITWAGELDAGEGPIMGDNSGSGIVVGLKSDGSNAFAARIESTDGASVEGVGFAGKGVVALLSFVPPATFGTIPLRLEGLSYIGLAIGVLSADGEVLSADVISNGGGRDAVLASDPGGEIAIAGTSGFDITVGGQTLGEGAFVARLKVP